MFSTDHIHPMIVHFPIALFYFGFLSEFVYLFFRKEPIFSEVGFWLFCVGAVSATAAYASGVFLTKEVYGAAGVVQISHELFAELTTIFSVAGAAFKMYIKSEKKEDGILKWLSFAIYAFTVILVSITGYYGGVLVYDYLITNIL